MNDALKIFLSILCFFIVFILGYKIVKAEKTNEKNS
jgi:hypothetical protein